MWKQRGADTWYPFKKTQNSNISAGYLVSTSSFSVTAENRQNIAIPLNKDSSMFSDDIEIVNGIAIFKTAGTYFMNAYVPRFGAYSSAAVYKNSAGFLGQSYVGADRVSYGSFQQNITLNANDTLSLAWGCTTWTGDTCGFHGGSYIMIIRIA